MAAVLSGYAETGLTTAKFVRRRRSDGAFWNTAALAFEAYSTANIANYGIAATEVGATGIYLAADPAEAVAGDCVLVKAAGANLAVTDVANGMRWQELAGVIDANVRYVNDVQVAGSGVSGDEWGPA